VIRKALIKHKIDVFFSPDGYICLNTNVPQVGTFHDLNFEHFPKDLRPSHSRYYRSQFPLFAKKAQHLITVSDFSKKDIVERYGVVQDKITVIHNGVNNSYGPISDSIKNSCRNKYSEGAPFFLYVGSLHSRKNIVRLIEAFKTFKKKSRSNTKLILAGNKYDWTPAMEDALNSSGYKDEIILTGRIYQADLIELMGSALALTYVSYFEGFGMPVLEAMRSETPVITSDCTSIPEVAGGAALMIDPFKVDAIAEAMSKVEASQELRLELIDKGKKQVALFNWDRCAEETWKVIENTHKNATIKP
jgi:glycosyltransferase involved in cell wall biosynthesis